MFENEGAGAGAGVPAGSPPAPAPGDSGASPAPGGAAPSPGASGQPPVEQLRQQYETTKRERDEWAKLGDRDAVARSHQSYTRLVNEVSTLGQQLGYDSTELQQAMETDPVGTLTFLRQAAKQNGGSDKVLSPAEVQKLIERGVKSGLKPFEQERELRLDQEAQSRFDGEFDRQFKTSFPNGLPDSNREALSGLAWSLLNDSADGYKALRSNGDMTHINAAFEQAKKTFLKIITDYGEHEKKRLGGPTPPVPQRETGSKGKRNLAQIAADLADDSIPFETALGR